MDDELQRMIDGAVKATPVGRERTNALKAIQWRFRGPNGGFVGLKMQGMPICAFVPEEKALVFDGRDNQVNKKAMYERALGPLTIEVLA